MIPKPLGTFLVKFDGSGYSLLITTPSFYTGKRCAYVYRANKEIRGSKLRVIWGTIVNVHGMFFF